jgi:hypothetical protein
MTPQERKEKETRIKQYLKHNKISKILNMQVEQTYSDLGHTVNVWNVKTNKGPWWVVEGDEAPMNLYTQDAFYFSTDEAYSFHMGITERLSGRYQKEFKHIIDEIPLDIEQIKSIKRKLTLASEQLSMDLEPEQMQGVGLICRESLIELGNELAKRNEKLVKEKQLKKSDFKGIANLFIDEYIPGEKNSALRSHSRKLIDMAWAFSSEIVHSSNKTFPDVKINILFVSAVVSLFENLFLKFLGFDGENKCVKCLSKNIEILDGEDEFHLIEHAIIVDLTR